MRKITGYNKWKSAWMGLMFCSVLCIQEARAQSIPADTALHSLQRVYRNYDSIAYLSFDVRFSLSGDTLLGNYPNEQMEGSYTIAGKKAKYRLGDIDYMQNDSFLIAVYNKDKLILVDEPRMNNTGGQLPMRRIMDSLVMQYNSHYSITRNIVGEDTTVIAFIRADSLAQFDRFSIFFDRRNYYLYKLDYQYEETAPIDSVGTPLAPGFVNRKQQLTIEFFNYKFANYDDSVYNENNYIYFERGVCKPVKRYANFKVYNSRPFTNMVEAEEPH